MAIWVFDPEVVLAFRRRHRRQVTRERKVKRNAYIAKPRDRRFPDALDKQWLDAVERDRS